MDSRISRIASRIGTLVVVTIAALPALADDIVDRVNAAFAAVSEDNRSDLVVLPTLIELRDPPASLAEVRDATLLSPDHRAWDQASSWAESAPQQTVLDAIADVTEESDFRKAMVFAQPYGINGVRGNDVLIKANLYTELFDPPMLAQADIGYMPKLRIVELLVHVEARRLLHEGDAEAAIKRLIDWLFFARQLADRSFIVEVKFALEAMRTALERIRDIAYIDSGQPTPVLTPEQCVDALDRLKGGAAEYLGVERLKLPEANFDAADQLIRRVIERGGTAKEDEFAPAMAKLGAMDRPLRLFSEAAYWDQVRLDHADWYESIEKLNQVRNDYLQRWSLEPTDPVMRSDSDYKKSVAGSNKFAILATVADGNEELFELRREIAVEAVGTRAALAVYGYTRQFRRPPTKLSTVRPRFIKRLDQDPFATRKPQTLQYIVVGKLPKGPQGQSIDKIIQAFPGGDVAPFTVPFLDEDDILIYSVGRDDRAGAAAFAVQNDPEAPDGDYLVWPPMVSLLRKHLEDSGNLD